MYVNNIVLLYEAGHSGMIDDTSSDDQEVTRMEDVLLENIDMLSDKRYRTVVYVDVHMWCFCSSKNRLSALAYIDKMFSQKIVTDMLTGRWAFIIIYCIAVLW